MLKYILSIFLTFIPKSLTADSFDTVVIGAGIAGLTAAVDLKDLGSSAQIFEASDRFGGRMFSKFDHQWNMPFEMGGVFINNEHTALRELVARFDCTLINAVQDGKSSYIQHVNGSLSTSDSNYAQCSHSLYFIHFLRESVKQQSLLISAAELLQQAQMSDLCTSLIRQSIRNEYGAELEEVSAQLLFETISYDFNKSEFLIDGGLNEEAFILRGGSVSLLRKMLDYIDGNIAYNHVLKSVTKTCNETYLLEFIYDDKTLFHEAQKLIVTIPLSVMREKVRFDIDKLPNNITNFIASAPMGRNQKLFLLFEKPVWKSLGYRKFVVINDNAWIWENGDDSNGYPFAGLTAFFGGTGVEKLNESPEEMVESVLTSLDAISLEFRSYYKGFVLGEPWHNNPFALGSYSGIIAKDSFGYGEWIEQCFENLCFAGEAWAHDENRGFMNGAVESAHYAVSRLF